MVKFLGVYSTRVQKGQQKQVFGGSTSTTRKQLYYVWRVAQDEYRKQAIDNAYNVKSGFEPLGQEEFYSKFLFEPRVQAVPLVHYEPYEDNVEYSDSSEFVEFDVDAARQLGLEGKTEKNIVRPYTPTASRQDGQASSNLKNISKHEGLVSSKDSQQKARKEQGTLSSSNAGILRRESIFIDESRLNDEFTDELFSDNYIDLITIDSKKEQEVIPESSEDTTPKISQAKLLEMELREKFALQLARYRKERSGQSVKQITTILQTKDGVVEEHRFMFSDFGIDLRKIKLYDLAKLAFRRAKDLQENDPNIWFNLSRVHYELREYRVASECIESALKIDPTHNYALKMQKAIKLALNPQPIIV